MLSGWGLKGDTLNDVEVLVDGVPCTVTESTLDTISCTTGEAAQVSNDGVSQPGSPGLTQYKIETGGSPTWAKTGTYSDPVLQTSFENNKNSYYYDGILSKGWFKAPATGNYRFYISCNEACLLEMDELTPYDAASPTEPTLTNKAQRHWSTEWRHYFIPPDGVDTVNQYISDWVSLTEGEFYKVEGYAMEWSGGDHFTVSVEYEQIDTAGHPQANTEI